ncbi:MAG: hypothetical protein WAK48_11825 [Candidatus Acidiferrum sp.]
MRSRSYGSDVFHLIGVSHDIQSYEPEKDLNDGQRRLSECLTRLVGEIKLAVIGEEMSLEMLPGRVSIPQEIAQKAGIEHRFCDPDSEERRAMGYRDRSAIKLGLWLSPEGWHLSTADQDAKASAIEIVHYFPMREQFWLDRLAGHKQSEVAFVLGDGHVESFADLLKTNQIPSRVVERGIGITQGDKQEDTCRRERALAYLEKHPEIRTQAISPRPPRTPDRS